MKSVEHIIDRAGQLRKAHSTSDRARIRAVMNGGAQGVMSVLNWQDGIPYQGKGSGKGADSLGVDLPTANIMWSGLERLAQKIGRPPTLKTDMIPHADTQVARDKAEKRQRIVQGWDDITRLEMQYPQIGRWLPGYGFVLHVVREQRYGDTNYPVGELRDPYDVYPGNWGVDQQPKEVASYRVTSKKQLAASYPHLSDTILKKTQKFNTGIPIIGEGGWDGPQKEVHVIEYMCDEGTYIVCPDLELMLDYIPNPLESGPMFVVTKRFSFDKLQSQFHHTFGLMAMMAKLNILGLIATEDATFRETNIIGELVGNTYERGRFAVNQFEPGSRIEKPQSEQLQQQWQAVNILERQFRIVAGYQVADDGQSPNSFATGQGIRELGAAANENVREYQVAIKHSQELLDRKRLEWEYRMHKSETKKVYWFEGGNHFEEKYTPDKDIDKDFRTRRVYGAMATFDEAQKVVSGLQLMQARIIDRRTLQENLDGMDNISLVNERIDQDMAKEQLIQGLGARMAQADPAAAMALVEILDKPGEANKTLKKLFTPQEPQMTPEEEQMAAMGAGGPAGAAGGPPPAVQTVLSQMETPGGGVQSVGQMSG